MQTDSMIFYGKNEDYKILDGIFSGSEAEQNKAVSAVLKYAFSHSLSGNLIKKFIACMIITDENPFSLSCEMLGCKNSSMLALCKEDMKIFFNMYNTFFTDGIISKLLDYPARSGVYSDGLDEKAELLCQSLDKADSADKFLEAAVNFYARFGAGMMAYSKAFGVSDENGTKLYPVSNYSQVKFSDLWGYNIQKQQIIDNTEAFIAGHRANNVLLYGDSGTGKSTCIKAMLNEYWQKGLRLIEVNKYQFSHLKTLSDMLKNRRYSFVFYLDDLSFEDNETEYKYLKAVIEGGIEPTPQNILIYATSNRRHLIRETWNDRSDMDADLHHSDTVQEKISLADRFGVSISFSKPMQKEYFAIVQHLAKLNKLSLDNDELIRQARIWGAEHGALTGRSAQQFIYYLIGNEDKK